MSKSTSTPLLTGNGNGASPETQEMFLRGNRSLSCLSLYFALLCEFVRRCVCFGPAIPAVDATPHVYIPEISSDVVPDLIAMAGCGRRLCQIITF